MNATQQLASVVIFGCVVANSFCQQPGTKLWEFTTGDRVESSPAIGADGTIYIGSWDNKLYAIDASGSNKWSVTVGGGSTGTSFMSSPAIGPDGTIYVGSNDKSVYAIRPNGTVRWSFLTGSCGLPRHRLLHETGLFMLVQVMATFTPSNGTEVLQSGVSRQAG